MDSSSKMLGDCIWLVPIVSNSCSEIEKPAEGCEGNRDKETTRIKSSKSISPSRWSRFENEKLRKVFNIPRRRSASPIRIGNKRRSSSGVDRELRRTKDRERGSRHEQNSRNTASRNRYEADRNRYNNSYMNYHRYVHRTRQNRNDRYSYSYGRQLFDTRQRTCAVPSQNVTTGRERCLRKGQNDFGTIDKCIEKIETILEKQNQETRKKKNIGKSIEKIEAILEKQSKETRKKNKEMDSFKAKIVDGISGWNERITKLEDRFTVLESQSKESSTGNANSENSTGEAENQVESQVQRPPKLTKNITRKQKGKKGKVPCPHCLKFLSQTYIWRHMKEHCKSAKGAEQMQTRQAIQSQSTNPFAGVISSGPNPKRE